MSMAPRSGIAHRLPFFYAQPTNDNLNKTECCPSSPSWHQVVIFLSHRCRIISYRSPCPILPYSCSLPSHRLPPVCAALCVATAFMPLTHPSSLAPSCALDPRDPEHAFHLGTHPNSLTRIPLGLLQYSTCLCDSACVLCDTRGERGHGF